MVAIAINKALLLKAIGRRSTQEIIDSAVTMGVEVEEETEKEILVDITPNRPDLLSQQGFTRALSAFMDIAPGMKEYTTTASKLKVYVDESTKEIRPYTACAVIRNLKLDEEKLKEIIDIQEKLHVTFCRKRKRAAIGIYPMDRIKGNITFKALTPENIVFHPLEGKESMSAQSILEKHQKGKEYAHLLQGLSKYPLFVDSKNNILSMPPIINSETVGKITTETTEAFLESSGFDQRVCEEIVRIICSALADMGATIHTVEVVYGKRSTITPDMSVKKQEFYEYYVNKKLGTSFRHEEFAPILAKMGLGFENGRIRDTNYALIPPYRVDILHQIDIVEDIAIGHGYDRIAPAIPQVSTIASETTLSKFSNLVRSTLIGYGFLEAKTYHLVATHDQKTIEGDRQAVTILSSVSEEYDQLRLSMIVPLLRALRENRTHEYPQMFFEIGTVFSPAEDHVIERPHLGIVIADPTTDYTRIRQIVDGLLTTLGLRAEYSPVPDRRFLSGRCARITIGEKNIGIIGEVAPEVLTGLSLVTPSVACEIDIGTLKDLTFGIGPDKR